MKAFIFLIIFVIPGLALSQCVSGDCIDGTGKYDYGFAVYEGEFKAGKPNGQGTMDYGAGDKFVGHFKDGREQGEGKLYKNNIAQDVTYTDGKIFVRKVEKAVGANAPAVKGCLQGDCYNGFGIVQYDSGNRFEGIFSNGLIGESGKFIYKNGDYFEGKFEGELNTEGKFFYADKNVTYNGTFYADGKQKTGTYFYPVNNSKVVVTNGEITKVDNPVARKLDSLERIRKEGRPCGKCGGNGMLAGISYMKTTESYYSINYVRPDGNIAGTSSGNVMRSSSMVTTPPSVCSACRGTGKVYDTGVIINTGRY